MKKEIQAVMLRLDKEKYLKVRHKLLDQGVTVNSFINGLIDKHLKDQRSKAEMSQSEGGR